MTFERVMSSSFFFFVFALETISSKISNVSWNISEKNAYGFYQMIKTSTYIQQLGAVNAALPQ